MFIHVISHAGEEARAISTRTAYLILFIMTCLTRSSSAAQRDKYDVNTLKHDPSDFIRKKIPYAACMHAHANCPTRTTAHEAGSYVAEDPVGAAMYNSLAF